MTDKTQRMTAEESPFDFEQWVRCKLTDCVPDVCAKPRTDNLAGTKYEIMGWLHVLCFQVASGKTYLNLAIEHQEKNDALIAHIRELEGLVKRARAIAQSCLVDPIGYHDIQRAEIFLRDTAALAEGDLK